MTSSGKTPSPPSSDPAPTTWLRSAALADGRVVDVEISRSSGTITAITTARREVPRDSRPSTPAEIGQRHTEIDLEGYLLLPAPVEPHAHLDKALTADLIPNVRGDLLGAIEVWGPYVSQITAADTVDRARRATLELLASGVTAVRTHVNVHTGLGLKAMEALLQVRDEMAELIDIQIVALVGFPLTGANGAENRALYADALAMDPEVIAGGCPHLDDSPNEATDHALHMAGTYGRMIDLHTDETLDASHLDLAYLAERILVTGFEHRVAASHCVSLAMQSLEVQHATSERVSEAGISVITLPQTNLFLQGRGHEQSAPRGLTALRPLIRAGVNVAAGADNVRDPFNTMGRSDPFETAALLVMAGHLLPHEAYEAVSTAGRVAMGLAAVSIEVGSPAELVAVLGTSTGDAIARGDQQRMVWHRGSLVASTSVRRTFGGEIATSFT